MSPGFRAENENTFQVQREMGIGISGEVYSNRKLTLTFKLLLGGLDILSKAPLRKSIGLEDGSVSSFLGNLTLKINKQH